ncbi:Phosphatidylglycerol/phosphatidylinositol transfer protein [Agyrium rufum]|nr:Phosphatidylglycerol/phosphatidylinositol transfer protein [Agyrium rufum]
MKLTLSTLVTLPIALAGISTGISITSHESLTGLLAGKSQKALAASVPVPGDNPLLYCADTDTNNHVLAIEHVNLSPNPPTPGATLTIEAAGTFIEKVDRDAYVLLTVKYGLITLIKSKEDLCDQLQNVDTDCPVGPGPVKIVKEVNLPNRIPPVSITFSILFVSSRCTVVPGKGQFANAGKSSKGKYTVSADVYNNDEKVITCLTTTIEFSR